MRTNLHVLTVQIKCAGNPSPVFEACPAMSIGKSNRSTQTDRIPPSLMATYLPAYLSCKLKVTSRFSFNAL